MILQFKCKGFHQLPQHVISETCHNYSQGAVASGNVIDEMAGVSFLFLWVSFSHYLRKFKGVSFLQCFGPMRSPLEDAMAPKMNCDDSN